MKYSSLILLLFSVLNCIAQEKSNLHIKVFKDSVEVKPDKIQFLTEHNTYEFYDTYNQVLEITPQKGDPITSGTWYYIDLKPKTFDKLYFTHANIVIDGITIEIPFIQTIETSKNTVIVFNFENSFNYQCINQTHPFRTCFFCTPYKEPQDCKNKLTIYHETPFTLFNYKGDILSDIGLYHHLNPLSLPSGVPAKFESCKFEQSYKKIQFD